MKPLISLLFVIFTLTLSSCNSPTVEPNVNSSTTTTESTGNDLSSESEVTETTESTLLTDEETTTSPVVTFEDHAIISSNGTTIQVHNGNELMHHMQSGIHFLLMPGGDYDLNHLDEAIAMKTLSGLENVILEGVGEEQVDFITDDIYNIVLTLEDCNDITLRNLNLGHNPVAERVCYGEVLSFFGDNQNITIENCTMFGCGTTGIYAKGVSGLYCKDSIIKDCTGYIMELYDVKEGVFDNCDFVNQLSQNIILNGCESIAIKNCRLTGGVLVEYPQINSDGTELLDIPNDGNEYIIDDRTFNELRLENVSLYGSGIVPELEKIHDHLEVTLTYSWSQEGACRIVSCVLNYESKLDESNYFQQIQAAGSILENATDEVISIFIYLSWPGNEDKPVRSRYLERYDRLTIYDGSTNIAAILGDQKTYLSALEAQKVLEEWLPPLMTVNNEPVPDETVSNHSDSIQYERTELAYGTVYYVFEVNTIGGDEKHPGNVFYLNAYDQKITGSNLSGPSFEYVPHEQMQRVWTYMRANGFDIPEDGVYWAYMNVERADKGEYNIILISDFLENSYFINDIDGELSVFVYEEYK